MLLRLTAGAMLAGISLSAASAADYIGGDPIGADSSLTDNTGGLTAVNQNGVNLGQPAMAVSLTGQELLTQFRAIVFGVPAANGNLFFNDFDYQLSVWQSADYYAGRDPQFQIALGNPSGVQLLPNGPSSVVPDTPFGTAGVGGNNASTYDFRFDLSNLPTGGPAQNIFRSPLPEGDWVFGFQSWHDRTASGSLRVSGSRAAQGPVPLFSMNDVIPRDILGGQDPSNITLHWGMSLSDQLAGDFNGDGTVSAADYTVWQDDFGAADDSSLHYAGDGLNGVDMGDYVVWQQHYGNTLQLPEITGAGVPEPGTLPLLIGGLLICLGFRRLFPPVW